MRTSRIAATAFAVALVGGAGLSPALAQQQPEQVLAMVTSIEQRMERGEFNERTRLEAARLHISLAEMYGKVSPEAVENLRTAAFYIGMLDSRRSADLLADAAERALGLGDVNTAAHSLLDAFCAWGHSKTAFSKPETEELATWLDRAILLAESPLLTSAERDAILVRIAEK